MQNVNRRAVFAVGGLALGAGAAARATSASSAPVRRALTPQLTEGPYYLAGAAHRADITDGLPGVATDVCVTIVDDTGARLEGAGVEIWHCDRQGRYSGFGGGGPGAKASAELRESRFLRGFQRANAEGVALFHTIYPGWYVGRTAHIHFMVWQGARCVLTSQFFLPDALSEFLYTEISDYKREELRDTLNRTDGIALMGGKLALGSLREADDRYVASLEATVDPNGDGSAHDLAAFDGGPGGGPRPGDGAPPRPSPAAGRGPPPNFGRGPPLQGEPPPGRQPRLAEEARLKALLPSKERLL